MPFNLKFYYDITYKTAVQPSMETSDIGNNITVSKKLINASFCSIVQQNAFSKCEPERFCLVLGYRNKQGKHGTAFMSLKGISLTIMNMSMLLKKKSYGSEHQHLI